MENNGFNLVQLKSKRSFVFSFIPFLEFFSPIGDLYCSNIKGIIFVDSHIGVIIVREVLTRITHARFLKAFEPKLLGKGYFIGCFIGKHFYCVVAAEEDTQGRWCSELAKRCIGLIALEEAIDPVVGPDAITAHRWPDIPHQDRSDSDLEHIVFCPRYISLDANGRSELLLAQVEVICFFPIGIIQNLGFSFLNRSVVDDMNWAFCYECLGKVFFASIRKLIGPGLTSLHGRSSDKDSLSPDRYGEPVAYLIWVLIPFESFRCLMFCLKVYKGSNFLCHRI